jgi:hypothetical protein
MPWLRNALSQPAAPSEEADALRLLRFNWLVIVVLAAALVIAMLVTGFSLKFWSALSAGGTAAVYLAAAFYNSRRGAKRDPLVIFTLGSTGQALLIAILIGPMTYVAASANFPMQDELFARIDHALGLQWPGYFTFLTSSDRTISGALFAYSMIQWPVFAIPVALSFARKYRRLQEFTLALALALIVTTAISAIVPANGIYDAQMLTASDAPFRSPAYLMQLHDVPLIRDGSLRELDLMNLAGIVAFPSFHATSAVLFLWAMWAVWWMRPIAAVTMGAMLFVTPFVGGHYFIDIIAGIAVAIGAIAAARWMSNWVLAAHKEEQAIEAQGQIAAAATAKSAPSFTSLEASPES